MPVSFILEVAFIPVGFHANVATELITYPLDLQLIMEARAGSLLQMNDVLGDSCRYL